MNRMDRAVQALARAVRARRSVLVTPQQGLVDLTGQRMAAASPDVERIQLVLPGSFNPLHEGHVGVLEEAAKVRRLPRSSIRDGVAVFEISMTNADKGAIDEAQLLERLEAFAEMGASVVVTADHPTFVSKAQLLPGRSFVMGYDTALRIVNPVYYEDAQLENMVAALTGIYRNGGRFLVGGRLCGAEFRCLTDEQFPLPPGLPADLFLAIPEFRLDISSTELRQRKESEEDTARRRTATAASSKGSTSGTSGPSSSSDAAPPGSGRSDDLSASRL